jgi:hypothetical protein
MKKETEELIAPLLLPRLVRLSSFLLLVANVRKLLVVRMLEPVRSNGKNAPAISPALPANVDQVASNWGKPNRCWLHLLESNFNLRIVLGDLL